MESVNCILCNNKKSQQLFSKPSGNGEMFSLVKCCGCGLEYVSPRPSEDEIAAYYASDYFTRRTDRGYDNYFSPEVRSEIERVFTMNLADLGFFDMEKNLGQARSSLDIGCAAGYFVNYMKTRGWDSAGIDVSKSCVDFAVSLDLNVRKGDYLKTDFGAPFDLITLWASLEHLHHPHLFIEKIRKDLKKRGMLYISTCRTGGINFKSLFGPRWRFYNFPEHLYFFSCLTLKNILAKNGFEILEYRTYGSGIGKPGSRKKKIADRLAKALYLGDMMIVAARRID